jgi:2'-5' RNA ligase
MRLFVALHIDDAIRGQIAKFVTGIRGFAPEARWVRAESLHVTLKFIGEQAAEKLAVINGALGGVQGAPIELKFGGCGFFPNPRSARVFWIGIAGSEALSQLASNVDGALEALGIARESHAYTPHLTLARGSGGSGAPHQRTGDRRNAEFASLREKLESRPRPEFGAMTAREFFLYESKLSPKGSQYTKLASFPLRSATIGKPSANEAKDEEVARKKSDGRTTTTS